MLTTESNIELQIESLLSPQFWQELAPLLHIERPDYHQVPTPLIPKEQHQYLNQLIKVEGYFHGNIGAWHTPLAPIITTIQKLRTLDLPPVFIFLYDEIWQLAYQLSSTISCLLGEQFWMLPDFWAWHINPAHAEAGWKPHRDKGYQSLYPDGSPSSLTAWIPLTPANPLNGCMYILPADRDPVYGTPDDMNWQIDYPSIRALPANPNEFFIWNQAVLHWGSRSSNRATEQPRISCAFEFQRQDIPAWNQPFITPNSFLNFNQRLNLIGKQLLQYQHMYHLTNSLTGLAQKMAAIS
ncbi:MAG: phytanoyl-CoA dioxygenase family protein [Gammaproteobacteria bacterium]|nr:phytanoyl-CoA dioxygenase family protein [Gammaproteobacteria bacterium]